jgi:hypothetical protein
MAGAGSWPQEFATYWLVLTGPKFYNVDSIRRALEPVFSQFFIEPSRWVAAGVPIVPVELSETSGSTRQGIRVDVTSNTVAIVGGPFDGYNARIGDRVITSVKAQLRFNQPPATLERLAPARQSLPATRQLLERMGAAVQQQTMRDSFGGSLPGDRGVPATPMVPPDPRNLTGAVIGMTMIGLGWGLPKIAEGELL